MDLDEFNQMMEWLPNHMSELDIVEQAEVLRALGEFRNRIKPIYDNYNRPKKFYIKFEK